MNTATSRQLHDASGITFLLSDHEKFGFSERLTYHFDLMKTLTPFPQTPRDTSVTSDEKKEKEKYESLENSFPCLDEKVNSIETKSATDSKHTDPRTLKRVCGVVALLECISAQTIGRKARHRLFRRIKDFNSRADKVRDLSSNSSERDSCYAPSKLPLQLTFTTRVAFVYELTRMVLCIDASPTLTATFGNLGTSQKHQDNTVCPMDRLEKMMRIYFEGLMEPIIGPNNLFDGTSEAGRKNNTSWWTPEIAITIIAVYPRALEYNDVENLSVLVQDYRLHDLASASTLSDKIADWAALEVESGIASRLSETGNHLDSSTSSLRCMVEACDIALRTLPSEGRPCIVLATDCRAVDCDSMLDLVQDQNLLDKPLHVLDLSGSTSHQTQLDNADIVGSINEPNYLMFDPDGPSSFPLSFPDDTEALYYACKAMKGCFFDETLLHTASKTRAGKVPIDSPFYGDTYFSKERKLQPNALQWYTFFSLSPCCPRYNPLGEVPPPRRLLMPKISQTKPMFLTYYSLSPVRVKGIIIMRIMDGYRVKQYGYNSSDGDKVSIHFTLPLESGVVIHYELSYVAFPNHNPMVGNANVKILVSGNQRIVQSVKNEFVLYQFNLKKPLLSVKQKACYKICRFLNWVKNEDKLESKLCPLEWGDVLSEGSHFLNYLKGLNKYQRYRHFRMDSFEVALIGNICTSNEPLLSEFMELDNGEHQLCKVMQSWSSFTIKDGKLYIKKLYSGEGGLTSYCLIEITKSVLARVSTVHLLFFEQVDTDVRLSVALSLKNKISSFSELVLAPRLFSKSVVSRSKRILMEAMNHHECWELLPDPELVPLISKRRSHFGKYVLVEDGHGYAMFVKFYNDKQGRSYLVQYRIQTFSNKVTVEMLMNWPRGEFCGLLSNSMIQSFTSALHLRPSSLFTEIFEKVKKRDLKCGRALRSRRNLLSLFEENSYSGDQMEDVERLLAYSSKSCIILRFFENSSGEANGILTDLTTSLLLSNSFDANVVKLEIRQDARIGNMEPGTWLLLRHDSHVLTFIHLPFQEQKSENRNGSFCVHRTVSFFTASIGGLYYTQDDLADDDSIERDETGHECVTDVADALESAHGHHYALAAYRALRIRSLDKSFSFTDGDFKYALQQCFEMKITHGVDVAKGDGLKLAALVSDMRLSPVPGGGPYFFYSGRLGLDENCQKVLHEDGSISLEPNLHTINNMCEVSSSGVCPTFKISNTNRAIDSLMHTDGSPRIIRKHSVMPPLFMKFDLNDKAASMDDIRCIANDCTLNAYMTIFDNSECDLEQRMDFNIDRIRSSQMHTAVFTKLKSGLNSFMAEQTLENLLREEMTTSNIQIVKKCLLKAENIARISVPLHFYVAKTDSMLDSSVLTLEDGDHQFTLFCSNIKKQNDIQMCDGSDGAFFAADRELSGWCYVDVPHAFGFRSRTNGLEFGSGLPIYVYHPAGTERAYCIASKVKDLVRKISHRVNQYLLLENLQKTRTASSLLIPSSTIPDTPSASSTVKDFQPSQYEQIYDKAIDYPPGHFQCSISYKTIYKLNPRCGNVEQIILQLQSSVLQILSLSNRRDVFVYIDSHGNIFYMRLQPHDVESDSIVWIVFGIQEAGISITQQLNRKLEKRIMSLTLEAISGVLTKNCRYNLLPTDISFLRSFREVWVEKDTKIDPNEKRLYEFPSLIYDPVMVLLFFRQNICGSTFFHILNEASTESEDVNEEVKTNFDPANTKDDTDCTSNGISITFNPREFSLCFNASQFQLDPSLQPVSTLTKTGKYFGAKAGTGVALIEIKLLHGTNEQVDKVCIGVIPQKEVEPLQIPKKLLRFREINVNKTSAQYNSKFRLSVRIINTTLNTEVVQRWIELTLNQALVSWVTERHIGKARLNLFLSREGVCDTKQYRENAALYGLSGLCSILNSSHQLPHPGIQKIKFQASIRATSLAKVAFKFLERGLIQPLFNRRLRLSDILGLKIIRIHKNASKQVRFSYENENNINVYDVVTNCKIIDGSADSPEYVCVFGLSPETEKSRRMENEKQRSTVPRSSYLFQNVSIEDHFNDDKPDSLPKALIKLDLRSSYALARRIAFVLTVTRSSQCALLYNWNPQTQQSAQAIMNEVYEDHLSSYNHTLISLQSRCLKDKSLIKSLSPRAFSEESNDKVVNPGLSPTIIKRSASESITHSKNTKSKIKMPTIVDNRDKISYKRAMEIARDRARRTHTRTNTPINNNLKTSACKPKETSSLPKVKLYENGVKSKQGMLMENLSPAVYYALLRKNISPTIFLRNTLIQTAQNLLLHRLTKLQGKELSLAAMNFILTHGILVHTELFPLIQPAVRDPIPFMIYLNTTISKSQGLILSKNFSDQIPHTNKMYNMKKIANSKHYTLYLIYEISMFRHHLKGLMGRCRYWLLTYSKTNLHGKLLKEPKLHGYRKKKNLLSSSERESLMINTFASAEISHLSLGNAAFDFVSNLLRRTAQKQMVKMEHLNIPLLLKETMVAFPARSQSNLPQLWYRLLHKGIVIRKSELYAYGLTTQHGSCFSIHDLSESMSCRQSMYDIVKCRSGDQDCFAGLVPGYKNLHFFLTVHAGGEEEKLFFDLYILCFTHGRWTIEGWFFENNASHAKKISQHIIDKSKQHIKELLGKAVLDFRRNLLWEKYTHMEKKHHKETITTFREVLEMRSVSSLVSVINLDSHFIDLLTHESNGLNMKWLDAFSSIMTNPFFSDYECSHIMTLEGAYFSAFLLYFNEQDLFLLLELDANAKFKSGNIMSRSEKKITKGSQGRKVAEEFTREFTNFMLVWIFDLVP